MRLATDHVRVRVPATSANLGPGFDTLGLAFDLWDEVEARAVPGPSRVIVRGEGAGNVPLDDTHLVVRAARRALDIVGAPEVGLHLTCRNRIPHGRGLGSSAAAVVAGGLIARGLIEDPAAMNARAVFELANEFEGHPDNAAPAVFGRATIAWTADGATPRCVRFDVQPAIRAAVLVPTEKLGTNLARTALPARVPHADAVFNVARAALMVHALTREPALLFDASEDRLHQSYRASMMPSTLALVTGLRDRGLPAMVSGAGPSVLVLTTGDVEDLARLVPQGWRLLRLGVAEHGGTVARVAE
ncbi:MAG: homoserine kinase [Bifidobacteriaceae bacterium]|jgi:homoserine kinase|nr:homoserine kinase [Bifidobacteriaceae bacterium]